jgi:hypothetical protein
MVRNLKPIDVSQLPDVLRIAEEVRRTRQPRLLRRDSEDVALVVPIEQFDREDVESSIWTDAGGLATRNPWTDYDAARAKRALRASAGTLARVDPDALLDDQPTA